MSSSTGGATPPSQADVIHERNKRLIEDILNGTDLLSASASSSSSSATTLFPNNTTSRNNKTSAQESHPRSSGSTRKTHLQHEDPPGNDHENHGHKNEYDRHPLPAREIKRVNIGINPLITAGATTSSTAASASRSAGALDQEYAQASTSTRSASSFLAAVERETRSVKETRSMERETRSMKEEFILPRTGLAAVERETRSMKEEFILPTPPRIRVIPPQEDTAPSSRDDHLRQEGEKSFLWKFGLGEAEDNVTRRDDAEDAQHNAVKQEKKSQVEKMESISSSLFKATTSSSSKNSTTSTSTARTAAPASAAPSAFSSKSTTTEQVIVPGVEQERPDQEQVKLQKSRIGALFTSDNRETTTKSCFPSASSAEAVYVDENKQPSNGSSLLKQSTERADVQPSPPLKFSQMKHQIATPSPAVVIASPPSSAERAGSTSEVVVEEKNDPGVFVPPVRMGLMVDEPRTSDLRNPTRVPAGQAGTSFSTTAKNTEVVNEKSYTGRWKLLEPRKNEAGRPLEEEENITNASGFLEVEKTGLQLLKEKFLGKNDGEDKNSWTARQEQVLIGMNHDDIGDQPGAAPASNNWSVSVLNQSQQSISATAVSTNTTPRIAAAVAGFDPTPRSSSSCSFMSTSQNYNIGAGGTTSSSRTKKNSTAASQLDPQLLNLAHPELIRKLDKANHLNIQLQKDLKKLLDKHVKVKEENGSLSSKLQKEKHSWNLLDHELEVVKRQLLPLKKKNQQLTEEADLYFEGLLKLLFLHSPPEILQIAEEQPMIGGTPPPNTTSLTTRAAGSGSPQQAGGANKQEKHKNPVDNYPCLGLRTGKTSTVPASPGDSTAKGRRPGSSSSSGTSTPLQSEQKYGGGAERYDANGAVAAASPSSATTSHPQHLLYLPEALQNRRQKSAFMIQALHQKKLRLHWLRSGFPQIWKNRRKTSTNDGIIGRGQNNTTSTSTSGGGKNTSSTGSAVNFYPPSALSLTPRRSKRQHGGQQHFQGDHDQDVVFSKSALELREFHEDDDSVSYSWIDPASDELKVELLSTELLKQKNEYELLKKNYQLALLEVSKLKDQVQELKGNVRVFCRLLPLNNLHPSGGSDRTFLLGDATASQNHGMSAVRPKNEEPGGGTGASGTGGGHRRLSSLVLRSGDNFGGREVEFAFDRVFGQKDTQATIYEEVGPLLEGIPRGFHLAIFAYGQTGSGKTYTLDGTQEQPGILRSALQDMLKIADSKGYQLVLSIVEIYNEQVRDLLEPPKSAASSSTYFHADYDFVVPDRTYNNFNGTTNQSPSKNILGSARTNASSVSPRKPRGATGGSSSNFHTKPQSSARKRGRNLSDFGAAGGGGTSSTAGGSVSVSPRKAPTETTTQRSGRGGGGQHNNLHPYNNYGAQNNNNYNTTGTTFTNTNMAGSGSGSASSSTAHNFGTSNSGVSSSSSRSVTPRGNNSHAGTAGNCTSTASSGPGSGAGGSTAAAAFPPSAAAPSTTNANSAFLNQSFQSTSSIRSVSSSATTSGQHQNYASQHLEIRGVTNHGVAASTGCTGPVNLVDHGAGGGVSSGRGAAVERDQHSELYHSSSAGSSSSSGHHHHPSDFTTSLFGSIYVDGLSTVKIHSWEHADRILQRARQSRVTGATALNDVSSRSHCIYSLGLRTKSGAAVPSSGVQPGKTSNSDPQSCSVEQYVGALHVIDLAGSERTKVSKAEGQRMQEAKQINKSLSALGDTLFALEAKHAHIPFRNSKLSYLLSDVLSQQWSKVLFIATVNPSMENVQESFSTLSFARRIANIEKGKLKANSS
ncbi:unnamed protein product [Amoebophrya sp. A120]|nr:unnamed protein product [Amoebophrya sp. A120]|eukprot:GSA120T00009140001.1